MGSPMNRARRRLPVQSGRRCAGWRTGWRAYEPELPRATRYDYAGGPCGNQAHGVRAANLRDFLDVLIFLESEGGVGAEGDQGPVSACKQVGYAHHLGIPRSGGAIGGDGTGAL